ncbi:MAG TPA: glycosyltransferase [Streptosporangiaceae bacterium]|jgi:glycosyltransferase involved in cell wall biosynthesis
MPTAYALLSTYPPTQCGLATFTAALLTHLPQPGDSVAVVRVLDEPAPRSSAEVMQNLVAGSVGSAVAAADVLNSSDVVIVQHEYGIYGGPDGQDVVSLLEALYVPTIVVLHTVLAHPTPRQRAILDGVIDAASAVVTMTQTARSRLLDIYGTSAEKVVVIPHGAHDNRVLAASTPVARRPTVLTWGLLGPGKGIEHAIDAMGMLASRGLTADYQVAGQTHPRVLDREGEAYRRALEARARTRNVADRVHFDGRFLAAGALARLIHAADVVLLPYDSLEQVTSGVLIEAVTAGKPVVSTCFPHAVELLGGGAGLLVDRQDPAGIAHALERVLTVPGLAARMSRRSADLAPQLLWPAVARSYRELASALTVERAGAPI